MECLLKRYVDIDGYEVEAHTSIINGVELKEWIISLE